MKKLLFIMNPFAGQKKANKVLPEILMLFTEAGYEINISMTTGPGSATRLAEGLRQLRLPMLIDSPTNQLFPIFTDEQWEKIEELGFKLEFNGRLDEDHVVLRVCTSWCTPDEYVDKFIETLKEL